MLVLRLLWDAGLCELIAPCQTSAVGVPDTRPWGHVLGGADPWGGWRFVARGALREQCATCHWIDPVEANELVPSIEHLEEIVKEIRKHEIVSGFDRRVVFSSKFRDRLLEVGVDKSQLRSLPIDLFTFDYLQLRAATCVSCVEYDGCEECGRVRFVQRMGRPPGESIVIADPGPRPIVRSGELHGRGYERGWSVYIADDVHTRLGLERDLWDVVVPVSKMSG